MLKVVSGQQKMRRTYVFEWFSKLKSGVTSAESTPSMTYPSVSKRDENVDKKKKLNLKNRGITAHEFANIYVRCAVDKNISSIFFIQTSLRIINVVSKINQTPPEYNLGPLLHSLTS